MKSSDIIEMLVLKYGQETLADKLGTTGSTLSKIRSGEYGMKLDCMDRAMLLAGVVMVPKDEMEELTTERIDLENALLTVTTRWNRERGRRLPQED
jgi:transcriptional regulator with XRE-family HTH domain